MERQPQLLGNLEIVITFGHSFAVARCQIGLGVPDAPEIQRIEREAILKLESSAVETVATNHGLRAAVAAEQAKDGRELLIEAEADGGSVALSAVIVADPHAVGP